jgi:hypothetical protein
MQEHKEHQRKYREKMYEAGFRQVQLWVKRNEGIKEKRMNMKGFNEKLKKLTAGWGEEELSGLYNLFIKIIKAKKEARELREKT